MATVAICKAIVLKSMKKCTHKAKHGTEYCGYHKKFVVLENATATPPVQVVPPPPPPPPPLPPSPVLVPAAENNECVICLTNITADSMKRTECNHTFHSKCLKEWTKRKNTCPCCRKNLLVNNRSSEGGRRLTITQQEYENRVIRAASAALMDTIEYNMRMWATRFSLNNLYRMRDLYLNDSSEYRRYTEIIAIRNHEDAMNAVY